MPAWAAANRLPIWVQAKLTLSTLPGPIYRHLKKLARGVRSKGGLLSEAQRKELLAFLPAKESVAAQKAGRGSPPEPTRSRRAESASDKPSYAAVATRGAELASLLARVAAIESASRRGDRVGERGKSGSRGRAGRGRSGSRRPAAPVADAANPGDGFAVVNRRALRAARRLSRANAVPKAAPAEAEAEDVTISGGPASEDKPMQPVWSCPACTAQGFVPQKQCPVCLMKFKPTLPPEQASQSVEELAARVGQLQMLIGAMTANGSNLPDEKAIIARYQAEVDRLQAPKPQAPAPPPSERHRAAVAALEAAQKRSSQVVGLIRSFELEIDKKQQKLQKMNLALAVAQQAEQAALTAFEEAQRALGAAVTPPASGTDAPAAPPTRESAVVAQALEALKSPGPELLESMNAQLGGAGEAQIAAIMALMVNFVSAMQEKIAVSAPLSAPAAPPTAPIAVGAARAPPQRPAPLAGLCGAGESCLPPRPDLKVESMNAASRTQQDKELRSKMQAKEGRSAELEQRRNSLGNPAEEPDGRSMEASEIPAVDGA